MSQAPRQHNLTKHLILETKGQKKIVPSMSHISFGDPMNKAVLKAMGSISSHVTDRSNAIKDPPRPSCKRVKLKQGSRKAKAFIIHDARNSDHLVIAITRIKTEGNVGMVVARVVVGCGQVDISSNTWIANDNGEASFTVGNANETITEGKDGELEIGEGGKAEEGVGEGEGGIVVVAAVGEEELVAEAKEEKGRGVAAVEGDEGFVAD